MHDPITTVAPGLTGISLPWEIVDLVRANHYRDAVLALATQRRIDETDAALLVIRWMDDRAREAVANV